jgi:hypothetical protein
MSLVNAGALATGGEAGTADDPAADASLAGSSAARRGPPPAKANDNSTRIRSMQYFLRFWDMSVSFAFCGLCG